MFGSSKFWESLAEGLAQRLLQLLFGPALIFWAMGIVALEVAGLAPELPDLLQDPADWVVFIIAVVGLVAGSGYLVESVQFNILRFLEGYGDIWPERIKASRIEYWHRRYVALRVRWLELAQRYQDLSPTEADEYRTLDRDLLLFPEDPARIMPTRLGNVLTAAELHSTRRYGVAAALMWPRLWLILPKEVQQEVTAARREFNASIRAIVWSTALSLWTMLVAAWFIRELLREGWGFAYMPGRLTPSMSASLWFLAFLALPAISGLWSYRRATATATTFGQLVSSAYDLHVRDLISSFGLTVADGEIIHPEAGQAVTLFVRRGVRPRW